MLSGADVHNAEPLLRKQDEQPDDDGYENAAPPRWRWLVLAAYCILPVAQNISYIAYSTVVTNTADFYDVPDSSVIFLANLANIMLVPATFVTMPIPSKMGLRFTVQLACIIVGIAGVVRLLATGPESFTWMIIAQAINGIP
jgi:hypothetical protein